ncbi:tyrosine-type recombinase/integrase [Nonomuraea sp. NPDC005701]|uniref:tyrosine-type recombinase/integrase n=2 Tax=unclassified Nonomuraea TaxID=2593643 RepID=UPI0034084C28
MQSAQVAAQPSVDMDSTPPSTMACRSVQEGCDTKTKKSRRTLAMPRRCVDALKLHRERQDVAKKAARDRWQDSDLVFASKVGTELDAHNVRRSFRAVLEKAGPAPKDWTPREMRHSFVSLLSDSGMPIEAISRLVGHRKQLRPMLLEGAEAMDRIFPENYVIFHLYAPTLDAAQEANGAGFGLRPQVGKPSPESPDSWPVTCEANAVISPDFVRETGNLFDDLAARHHGQYDGWQAAATP